MREKNYELEYKIFPYEEIEEEKRLSKAVILAAGIGKRLRPYSEEIPKTLLKVGGREILYRNIKNLQKLGINEFVIVTNPKYEKKIREFLNKNNINAKIIINPFPERENGYSVYILKDYIQEDEEFILLMGDHIYEEDFFYEAIQGRGLIIDEEGKYIDKKEATKVYHEDGRIVDIGKSIEEFNGFDTGFFILDGSIFKYAEELENEKNKIKMSEIVKRANLECTPVSGYFWMDVDTFYDLKKARKFLIKNSVKTQGDGFISRFLNRKLSTKISEFLVDRITPNQATIFSFLTGILASFICIFNIPWGAILYQVSSVLDGIDGEIARVSMRRSRFGGWMDSVLDRVVDFLFLTVLTLKLNPQNYFLFICLLAIFGSLMVSYVSERFKGAYKRDIYEVIPQMKCLIGKRDERIFIIFLFSIFGLLKELFIIIAIITNLRVILTSYFVWKKFGKETYN